LSRKVLFTVLIIAMFRISCTRAPVSADLSAWCPGWQC